MPDPVQPADAVHPCSLEPFPRGVMSCLRLRWRLGRMKRSTALAKPSSSLEVVTCVASCCTSSAGVGHGNAQAALGEHEHVVRLVADRGDLAGRDVQEAGHPGDHGALVGARMRHVQVVGLRARGRDLLGERLLRIGLTARDRIQVVADPDDLDHVVQQSIETGNHRRRELDGPLLPRDMRRVLLLDEPVLAPVDPYRQAVRCNGRDDTSGDAGRQDVLLDDRHVGSDEHAAVETRDGRGQGQRLDQHRHPARRASAGDGKGDSGVVETWTASMARRVRTLSCVRSVPSTSAISRRTCGVSARDRSFGASVIDFCLPLHLDPSERQLASILSVSADWPRLRRRAR